MNSREIEQLEKKSIYSSRINNELKDQVINKYLDELIRVIKTNVKRKKILVIVIEMN
jgi:hypothetical protein